MSRTTINLVTDEGLDPTGKTDSLGAWERGIAAALKNHLPLELPGTDTVSTVSDTIKAPLAGGSLAIVGEGGKVQTSGGWKLPPRQPNAWQGGRHLFTSSDGPALVMRDLVFDYRGALNPECVGDIIRATRVGTVDAANVKQYNPRGLTTNSTPDMPETFTFQLLHVGKALLDACPALALDGAPTATGIVAHWCDDATIRNTVVAFMRGQGLGLFSSKLVRWLACWCHANGNNFNAETGPDGFGQVFIGDPNDEAQRCLSSGAHGAGVNVNRNHNGRILTGGGVFVNGLRSEGDRSVLRTVGKLLDAGAPAGDRAVMLNNVVAVDPVLNLVNCIAGGDPTDIGIRAMSFTNTHRVPELAPRSLEVPAAWDIHPQPIAS